MPNTNAFDRINVMPMEVKEFDEDKRTFWATASTPQIDRTNEIVASEAMEETRDRYMANPIMTWQHDTQTPIGYALDARITERESSIHVYLTDATEEARKALLLVKDKVIRCLSIGFSPYSNLYGAHPDGTPDFEERDDGVKVWKRIDWLETALVSIPANTGATLAFAKSLGLDMEENAIAPEVELGAVPFGDLPLAPEERPWDKRGASWRVRAWANGDDMDWAQYRKAFLWYDTADKSALGAYKLGFADIIDGELSAVWRGVAAAVGALHGARGGVDIPDADKARCLSHAKKYYKAFDKPFPEKGADDATIWKAGEEELAEEQRFEDDVETVRTGLISVANITTHWRKEGRDLSADYIARLAAAREELDRLLQPDVTEAGDDGQAGALSGWRIPAREPVRFAGKS